jgi:hypothetical protein
MKTIIILSFALLSLSNFKFPVKNGDRCSDWAPYGKEGREAALFIKICEYESGNSGYIQIKNENKKEVSLTYVVNFKNGKSQTGRTSIPANKETSGSSCWQCAEKNGGGILSWRFEKIKFEGE